MAPSGIGFCLERSDATSPQTSPNAEDLTLKEIVDLALRTNPATKQTWAVARAAAFTWEDSKVAYVPTIEGTVQSTYSGRSAGSIASGNAASASGSSNTSFSPAGYSTLEEISLSYLLLDFGGRAYSVRSAAQAMRSANWLHDQSIQDVIVGVLNTFYNYISIQAAVEAKKMDLQDAELTLESADVLYKAGLNTHVDVLQAKAQVASQKLGLQQLEGSLNVALGSLKTAIGLPANYPIKVQKLPEVVAVARQAGNVDDLIEVAKSHRADLASTQAQLEQSRADFNVIRSSVLPTITANAVFEQFELSRGLPKSAYFYSGSLSLNIPFSDMFLHGPKVAAARENVRAAKASLATKEFSVVLDVLTNYYAVKTGEETIRSAEEYLGYSQEAFNEISANYKAGVASILDVMAAQDVLANARLQKIQAQTLWLNAMANLAHSTGRLEVESIPTHDQT